MTIRYTNIFCTKFEVESKKTEESSVEKERE